jgi:hypothetical protein
MVDTTSALVLGFHGAIAVLFLAIGILGLLSGAALAAVATRLVTAVLVLALGVVVARIVRRR